jgi:hypothetical protein
VIRDLLRPITNSRVNPEEFRAPVIAVASNGTNPATDGAPFESAEPVKVTPEMARAWLDKNAANRKIRPSKVDVYKADMLAGRWRGGDGMLKLDHLGNVINGQHRLTAFLESGLPFIWLLVQVDEGDSRSFRGDNGIIRTIRDASGDPALLSATANALLRAFALRTYSRDEIIDASRAIDPHWAMLTTSTRQRWTRAGIVAGVILNIYRFPADAAAIAEQYNAIAERTHPFQPWASVHSLWRQMDMGVTKSNINGPTDHLLRAAAAFNPAGRHSTKIVIKDPARSLKAIRPAIGKMLGIG